MSAYNTELLLALSNQISVCVALKQLDQKLSLNLFNVLTPGIISAIDGEINANPYLLSEAISLLEVTDQLSAFYTEGGGKSFITNLKSKLIESRTTWAGSAQTTDLISLHKELMEEYFVDSGQGMSLFLDHNPVYLGVYLYVYIRILSMI